VIAQTVTTETALLNQNPDPGEVNNFSIAILSRSLFFAHMKRTMTINVKFFGGTNITIAKIYRKYEIFSMHSHEQLDQKNLMPQFLDF
jgi:hypothetical protein